MTRDYIRNYLTYSLPGHLTIDEWGTILTKIETLLAEERAETEKKYHDWMRKFAFEMASLGVVLPQELDNIKEVIEAIKNFK